jgi:hypothetical protein
MPTINKSLRIHAHLHFDSPGFQRRNLPKLSIPSQSQMMFSNDFDENSIFVDHTLLILSALTLSFLRQSSPRDWFCDSESGPNSLSRKCRLGRLFELPRGSATESASLSLIRLDCSVPRASEPKGWE